MHTNRNWTRGRAAVIAVMFLAAIGLAIAPYWLISAQAASPVSGAVTAKASGTVTAGRFVKLTAAGIVAHATSGADSVVGVAQQTALTTTLTSYAPVGTRTTVTSGEAIAVGDLLVPGASGYAYVLRPYSLAKQRIGAIALAAATGSGTAVDCIVCAGISPGSYGPMTAVTGATTIVDPNDSGRVFNVTTSATITLPACGTVPGGHYTFVNGGADGTVAITISPNASDRIDGNSAIGVDNKDIVNTAATALRGDWITITNDANAGWKIVGIGGVWDRE